MNRWLLLALPGLALAGCAADECTKQSAAFELAISTMASDVTSVNVTVSYLGNAFANDFPVDGELADGTLRLAVNLDPAPADDFDITIGVEARNGGGQTVAMGMQTFGATADACNVFDVSLTGGQPDRDGGVPDAGEVDGGDPRDGGDPLRDGGPRDGGDPNRDGGPRDGGDPLRDGGPPPRDGGEPLRDGGPLPRDGGVVEICATTPDNDTVALYTFENDATDETTNHDGNEVGGPNYAAGPAGCGQALSFGNSTNVGGRVVIPDSNAFDLTDGSIDVHVRLPSVTNGNARTVLSRNSIAVGGGEFALRVACDGTIVASLFDGATTVHRCSTATIPANTFVFLGVNFGQNGFELYVDGTAATETGTFDFCGTNITCGGTSNSGLAGNNNPLVVGAFNESTPGASNTLDDPFRGGRIDSLRISSANRAY